MAKRLFQTDCEYAEGTNTVFLRFDEESGKLIGIRCFRIYRKQEYNNKCLCKSDAHKGKECLHVYTEWINFT